MKNFAKELSTTGRYRCLELILDAILIERFPNEQDDSLCILATFSDFRATFDAIFINIWVFWR